MEGGGGGVEGQRGLEMEKIPLPRAKGTIAINFWNSNHFLGLIGENVMISPTVPVGIGIPGSGLEFRPGGW